MLELSTTQKPFYFHILHNDAFTHANRFGSIRSVAMFFASLGYFQNILNE